VQSADFVVGGYTSGKGSRASLGALLLGYWDKQKKLHYASHVGSGFDDRSLRQVQAKLEPLKRKTSPFVEKPVLNGAVTWVEPAIVAEVKFQSWTDDGALRAPVFLRLRDDIDAKSVRRVESGARHEPAASENNPIADVVAQLDTSNRKNAFTLVVGAEQIRLTHLDRVYWPENPALQQPALTKRDLLRYFAQVSPYMLPHLADRPLTMIRMPDGINKQRFFQKHWEQERPEFTETITVYSGHKDESHEYLLCNNLPTLLWLAQSGTLEFHIWHSRAKVGPTRYRKHGLRDIARVARSLGAEYPDYVVFDIDPYIYSGKEAKARRGTEHDRLRKGKVAFWLREVLHGMSLDRSSKPRARPVCMCSCRSSARSTSMRPGGVRTSAGT
jgi:bifunctional non-homologous end joining protein LigD